MFLKFLVVLFIFNLSYAQKALILTDIHFNPYYTCEKNKQIPCKQLQQLIVSPIEKWGNILDDGQEINSYKEETNNKFMINGLKNLKPILRNNEVNTLFLTGDLLTHGFDDYYKKFSDKKFNQDEYTNFVYKTIIYVIDNIKAIRPELKIYFVLGNNDSDNGNYQTSSRAILNKLANYLKTSVINKKEFDITFSEGAYYSIPISDKVNVIGINTNCLSTIHTDKDLANKQYKWLEQELAKLLSQKKRIIILQHIPYGADMYKSAKRNNLIFFFDLTLQPKYLALLEKYKNIITNVYTGHIHTENISLINSKNLLVGTIAFNAKYGNNPGFKIIDIDSSGALIDYTTYYTVINKDNISWQKLYTFSKIYKNNIIYDLPKDKDSSTVTSYRKYFNGNNLEFIQPISSDNNWKFYYCAILNVDRTKYKECVDSF